MGKVAKAVITVAAAVAIAIYAPQIAAAFLTAGASAASVALATTAVTAVLTLGVAVAFKALGLTSRVGPPSTLSAAPLPTCGLLSRWENLGTPRRGLELTMQPITASWYRRLDVFGLGHLHIIRNHGNCMHPVMTDEFAVIDMRAPIRSGDLFFFDTRDFAAAWPEFDRASSVGLTKRFMGIDRQRDVVEFETTTPPRVYEIGTGNIILAYRVRATAPTEAEARRIKREIRRDPTNAETAGPISITKAGRDSDDPIMSPTQAQHGD